MAFLNKTLLNYKEDERVQKIGIQYYEEDFETQDKITAPLDDLLYDASLEDILSLHQEGLLQLTPEELDYDMYIHEGYVDCELDILRLHEQNLLPLSQEDIDKINNRIREFEEFEREMERIETLYEEYRSKAMSWQFENEDLQKVQQTLGCKGVYSQYISALIRRNGQPTEDYAIFNEDGTIAYKNPRITKQGFSIHHIKENRVANLSTESCWYGYPEFQVADTLVYASDLEHNICHYLIGREDPFHSLGLGGLFNKHMLAALKESPSISENDYLGFCYLIGSINTATAANVEKVLNNKLVEYDLYDRFARVDKLKEYTMRNCPYGITTISIDTYEEVLGEKCIKLRDYKVQDIYVLRTKTNRFMLMAKRKNNNKLYYLIYGKAVSNVNHTPEWYLPKIDDYQALCTQVGQSYLKAIQPVVDAIKAAGGTGEVHGSIIDIDYFHHLKIDFEKKMFIPYCAPNKSNRVIYPHLENMVQKLVGDASSDCLALTPINSQALIAYEQDKGFIGLTSPIVNQVEYHNEKGFYSYHINITRIIDMGVTDFISKWFLDFDTDKYWSDYYNFPQLTDNTTE